MSVHLDDDGLPLFPPLPGGRVVQVGARSVARLVAGLRTAVLSAHTESLAAMVVFLDHEPIDGLAVRGERRLAGPDALDELEDVPADLITVTEVAPELARVLGSYFLPTTLRAMPAGVVVPEAFVRSLARPGQRGCVIVRSGDDQGLVYLAGGEIVLAHRRDAGGFEQVAPLFEDPSALLWARLGAEQPDRPAQADAAASSLPAAGPVPAPPADAAAPAPRPATSLPADRAPVTPSETPGLVELVLREVREVLGPHAVRVEGMFLRAEPTADGLRAAADALRERRLRLLSPETIELVANRAEAVLDRAGPGLASP